MSASRGGRFAAGPWLVALATLVLGVARYAPFLDEPWESSTASINGAIYQGRMERSWRVLGFEQAHGIPFLNVLPTVPPVGARSYLNHPPLYPWIAHLVVERRGLNEASIRILPAVLAALGSALLAAFVARRWGTAWGAAAGTIALSAPMGYLFGWMASPYVVVPWLGLAALLLHGLLRDRTWPCYAPVWILVTLATDWKGWFALPAIWLLELFPQEQERRWGRALGLVVPAVLATGGVLSVFSWWNGRQVPLLDLALAGLIGGVVGGLLWIPRESRRVLLLVALLAVLLTVGVVFALDLQESAGATIGDVIGTARAAAGARPVWTAPDWFRSQGEFWVAFFGWPLSILAAIGLPWLLMLALRGRDVVARIGLASLVPALLGVAIFHRHAFEHDFWWYDALPYVVLAGTLFLRTLRRVPWLPWILLLALVAWNLRQTWNTWEAWRVVDYRGLATEVNARFGPRDLLVQPGEFDQSAFYFEPWFYEGIDQPRHLEDLVGYLRGGLLDVDRIVFILPAGAEALYPDLAAALPHYGPVYREHGVQLTIIE